MNITENSFTFLAGQSYAHCGCSKKTDSELIRLAFFDGVSKATFIELALLIRLCFEKLPTSSRPPIGRWTIERSIRNENRHS